MAFRRLSSGLRRQASNAAIAMMGASTLALLTLSPTGVSALSSLQSVASGVGAPVPAPVPPQDSSAPPGLADAPAGTDIGTPGRGVVRSRAVVVLLDAFPSATATAPASVALPLFEDVRVEAQLDPPLARETYRSWRGTVTGGGDVVLVEKNGFVAGSVTSMQGRFRLRALDGGVSVLEEIDPGSFPEAHEHPLPPEGTAPATTDGGAVRLRAGVSTGTGAHDHDSHDHSDPPVAVAAASLPGSGDAPAGAGLLAAPALVMAADGEVITIDVLVAYSTGAKTHMGGTGPVEADIALAVEQTNTAFATSDVAARLSLVGSPEVPANGNVSGAVLDSLRNPAGAYGNLHTLRDALGADLVALIVDDTANQYCGIAYQMGPNGNTPAFASAAFSVTDAQCSTGALTFPHELGHNFGAAHDRGAWSGTPVYPYGYGWVNAAAHWRDVMSYANACAGCTRLLRYSNPDQTYNGAPIGAQIGTAKQADNRAVFNATAGVVASFRGAPVPTSLTVVAPAGGAAVAVPGPLTVRWNATGAIGGTVKVELLRGSSVVAVLAPAAATGVGAVTWKAPATLPRGTDYAVRLTSVANPAATTTSDPFSITDPALTLTSAEGESWAVGTAHPVTWTYTGAPTGGVKLELLRAERVVGTIAGAAPLGSNGQGTYAWTPLATLGAYPDYRVRATLASVPTVRDGTDQDLALTGGPQLTLTAPTAGATWAAGSTQTVSWTATGVLGRTVKVELLLGTAVAAQVSVPGTSTSVTLKLPAGLPSGSSYTVRATAAASTSLFDVTDGPMTVDGATLTLTSAEPGSWVAGSARVITWASTGTPGTAGKVELVHPTARPLVLVASTPLAAGSTTVRLPASIATNLTYRLRLSVIGNPLLTATGEEVVATLPTLSFTEPGAVTAGQPATVGWAFSDDSAVPVVVELMSGVRVVTRVASAPTGAGGVGTYTWKVPATLPGGSYTLRVRPVSTATSDRIQGTSDMTVTGPTVSVLAPTGGSWARGSTQTIEWTTSSYAGTTAKVELMRGDKVAKALASAARMTGASASVSVLVPSTLTVGPYTVRVTLLGGATAQSAEVTVS